jgi:hypothetical protein
MSAGVGAAAAVRKPAYAPHVAHVNYGPPPPPPAHVTASPVVATYAPYGVRAHAASPASHLSPTAVGAPATPQRNGIGITSVDTSVGVSPVPIRGAASASVVKPLQASAIYSHSHQYGSEQPPQSQRHQQYEIVTATAFSSPVARGGPQPGRVQYAYCDPAPPEQQQPMWSGSRTVGAASASPHDRSGSSRFGTAFPALESIVREPTVLTDRDRAALNARRV